MATIVDPDGVLPVTDPRVSVIIPTFNSDRHLDEALCSISAQSFSDIEILIIDEASSTGDAEGIVQRSNDARIRYIRNGKDLGLARSLNAGIGLSRGELIARMDADDIASPERLEMQVGALDRNRGVGAVGTAVRLIDKYGRMVGTRHYPCAPVRTRWLAHFNAPMAHPSVMFRRSLIERIGPYSEEHSYCEDYELWLRALGSTDIINLPTPLLHYRIHDDGVSTRWKSVQSEASLRLSCRVMASTLGTTVDPAAVKGLKHPYSISSRRQLSSSILLLHDLADAFIQGRSLDHTEKWDIRRDVAALSSHLIMRSARLGPLAPAGAVTDIARCRPSSLPQLHAQLLARLGERIACEDTGLIFE